MTEQIQGIIKTGVVDRRSTGREQEQAQDHHFHNREGAHRDGDTGTDDTVEISEEARQRANGTYRKNILEHMEGDD